MADPQNHNFIAHNPIPDDIGIRGENLAHIASGYRTATIREIFEPIANLPDMISDALCGLGIKIVQVIISTTDRIKRRLSPNNPQRSSPGWRHSFAFRQLQKPLADFFMRHNPASRVSSLSFGIKTRLMSFIRLKIKNRV
jgi:hypothetical protein